MKSSVCRKVRPRLPRSQAWASFPLIVLSRAPNRDLNWDRKQTNLLDLSSNSQQLFADRSGHNIQLEQPEAAVRAIAQMVEHVGSPGNAVVQATVADASRVPEIGDLQRRFYAERLQLDEVMIRRAIDRGEIPADTDPAEVIKTLIAPIYLRLLITAEPIDATTADRATEVTLVSVGEGVLRSR